MIIEYDLTAALEAIARRLPGGRFVTRYASPHWTAELTTIEGETHTGQGPTASQAIEALGKRLRRPAERR